MTKTPILALALGALILPAAPALAQDDAMAGATGTASLATADGTDVGTVTITVGDSGVTLVVLDGSGMPPGEHAIHVHEVGDCGGEGFESAGGHIADGKDHGAMVASGPHPGDLPNIYVSDDGSVMADLFAVGLTEDMLFDDDGAAVIVHADPDDYTSQPSGDAGDRLACGVVERPAS